jgi:hypothetical protein
LLLVSSGCDLILGSSVSLLFIESVALESIKFLSYPCIEASSSRIDCASGNISIRLSPSDKLTGRWRLPWLEERSIDCFAYKEVRDPSAIILIWCFHILDPQKGVAFLIRASYRLSASLFTDSSFLFVGNNVWIADIFGVVCLPTSG